jgi:hypothetical protein
VVVPEDVVVHGLALAFVDVGKVLNKKENKIHLEAFQNSWTVQVLNQSSQL